MDHGGKAALQGSQLENDKETSPLILSVAAEESCTLTSSDPHKKFLSRLSAEYSWETADDS